MAQNPIFERLLDIELKAREIASGAELEARRRVGAAQQEAEEAFRAESREANAWKESFLEKALAEAENEKKLEMDSWNKALRDAPFDTERVALAVRGFVRELAGS